MTEQQKQDLTRAQIIEFLPGSILKAVKSYQDFIESEGSLTKSKEYAEKQRAGRMAIAHIDLLIKFTAQMESQIPTEHADALQALVKEAKSLSDSYDHTAFAEDLEDLA